MGHPRKARIRKRFDYMLHQESGVVAVIVGICLFALMIATALAVDVGSIFEDRRHLQTVADAAALAGAQELPEDPVEAENRALAYATQNYYVEELEGFDVQISATFTANDTITVTAWNPDSLLYFAKVMDRFSTPVGAKAAAVVAKPLAVSNVVPWGLDKEFFDDWEGGGEYPLKYHTPQEPGNFMALDLDNEHGGGSNEYRDRVVYGYEGLLSVGDEILTETGNMAGPSVQATEERVEGIGNGWQGFDDLTVYENGAYDLVGADTQFVVVPIISLEGLEGQSEHIIIEGFVTMIVTSIDGSNPGQSNIVGTFVDRAFIITEGSVGAVEDTGLRVIRLIR